MKVFTKGCGLQIKELLLLIGWKRIDGIEETLSGEIEFKLELKRVRSIRRQYWQSLSMNSGRESLGIKEELMREA